MNNISSEIILNKSTDVKNLRKSLSDKNLKIYLYLYIQINLGLIQEWKILNHQN